MVSNSNTESKPVTMASPWIIYSRKVEAMFKGDPDVHVNFNNEDFMLLIDVEKRDKAFAISKILPKTATFGSVTVKVIVLFEGASIDDPGNIFSAAFEGNSNFKELLAPSGQLMDGSRFVIFKKSVVQYANDNIYDAHGICSTLSEELARELFVDCEGVFFCTDTN